MYLCPSLLSLLAVTEYEIPSMSEMLGMLVMEALTLLLSGNASNANVFRECGGARCAHNLVPYPECRQQVLGEN
jgi:hypothetical protein